MNISPVVEIRRIFFIAVILVIASPFPCRACSVPVYQYALAYWPADLYEVIVFHRGPLPPEDLAALDRLKKSSWEAEVHANVTVTTVDLSESTDVIMQKLWESQSGSGQPWMMLKYPRVSQIPETVWSVPFTATNVEALLDSPVRKEITRRILEGDSAVWVFLDSGVQEQDEAAASLLESQLRRLSAELRITVPEEWTEQFDETELRVKFSMVRVSRNDPDEEVLTRMLLSSEWDLRMLKKPMAFPIFGRGRALYALVGDGIRDSNIERACSFLAGWCSCEIKEQNPGVDILMSVNWDNVIDGSLYRQTTQLLNASRATATEEGNSNIIRNILIVLLFQLVIVAILAFAMLWRRRRRV